jgi:hypothetical protein
METKRLEERLGQNRIGDPSTTRVQAIFRDRSQFDRIAEPFYEQVGAHRALAIALVAAAVIVVWFLGYAIGRSSPGETAGNASQDVVIAEQTDLLQQQSIDLQNTRSSLAVAEGEAAFLRSQVSALSGDAERLQGSLNQVRIEMSIIVGIYEECLDRLYPAECIEQARPAADSFLAELYAEAP